MIRFVCKYTPLELFEGFGVSCARLDPSPVSFDCADSCGHPNLCGYGKAVIETVLDGGIDELVLTDCCDVMRRVYDILKTSGSLTFLYLLPLPHKSGPAEISRFAEELRRLADAYAQAGGRSFDAARAEEACRETERRAAASVDGPHISLTGAHGGERLYGDVAVVFSLPVTDDTCTGRRDLALPSGEGEFFTRYAEALLRQGQPCMRMLENGGRNRPEQVKGLIYHTIKFCDYYGFEYMGLRKKEAVPLLKIETDCTPQSRDQLATRLEAFAETLHAEVPASAPAARGPLRYVAGVDSGSASTDAVVMDSERNILGRAILSTGSGAAVGAERALEAALREADLSRDGLDCVVTTGYGRRTVGLGEEAVTEITCHAKGARFLNPQVRTVIDIGGQDSKVILLDEDGMVVNFIMNDKCAAGTGRFLDMMARTLELSLPEMSELGLHWKADVDISSMCTVFAESEVVSLVARNTAPADIIHGLNKAVAGKTVSLVRRLGGSPAYMLTGGVARNRGVVEALQEKLGESIFVCEESQLCGAIGAALIALEGRSEQLFK